MKTLLRKINIKLLLKISAVAIATGILLLLACLPLLPFLLNSNVVQSHVQKSLSTSMKRNIVWSGLNISWSNGLTLSGLKLGDAPPPLLKADIDLVTIVPALRRDDNGRFGIDLDLKIKNVRAEFAPGSAKPQVPPSKDPLTLIADSIQRLQGFDYPLPVNLRVVADVSPLQIVYRTPDPDNTMQLKDFSFRFSMPSLASKPVTVDLNGRVAIGQREIGKVDLKATINDLVTKEERIHLPSAQFIVAASVPGTKLLLSGGLNQADGIIAKCTTNLAELLEVIKPLLPPSLPELDGKFEIEMRAKGDQKRDISVGLNADATDLVASSATQKNRRAGPFDIKLQQKIVTDHIRQRVEFPDGKLTVNGLISAKWSALVDNPTIPERSLEFNLEPVSLDFTRLFSASKAFLLPALPLKEMVGEAFFKSMSLKIKGAANNGSISVVGMGAKFPLIRVSEKGREVKVENIDLLLGKVECPLIASQPVSVTGDLLWSVHQVAISGLKPLLMQGGRGKIELAISDLNLHSKSPRKFAASIAMTQLLELDKLSLGNLLAVGKVHEQLRFLARADDRGVIDVNIPEFDFSAASIQAVQSGKKFSTIPLSAAFTASGLHIPVARDERPTLQRAEVKISAGDFLQLVGDAFLPESIPQKIATKGRVQLDLKKGMQFAAPLLPAGLKSDGLVNAAWNMTAPIPEKAMVDEKHPLKSARTGLSMFDKLEVTLKLDNISAAIPGEKGTIKILGLQSKPDIHISSLNNGASARFEGGILFAGISGLPGAAANLPSQQGSFLFNGELEEWKSLHLSEKFRIDPLAVFQSADINVSRIDSLFDEKQPFNSATLIKRLDATVVANIDAELSGELKQTLPGIDMAGSINGSFRADLTAGRELAVRGSLKSKDFGVSFADGTKIEGVRSDFSINRVFALAAASKIEPWTPLSNILVRPPPGNQSSPGATDIATRIYDDLRGDINGKRTFSIRRITTKTSSGVPIVLSSLEGNILLTQEKAGLSFFQADLLGGTLLARGLFDLRPEIPLITLGSSFSNLDITRLLPKDSKKRQTDQDAEISGEMNLSIPLTSEQRELLEQLRLSVNIRKIGANAIERALFSLDPFERNEQVVAQRKLLKLGTLKGLRATAVDGAFSMEGEALIKGIGVDLPKVDRLRISELPLRQEFSKNRKTIAALRTVMDLVRADTIVVGSKGELLFKRRKYAQ